LCDFSQAVVGNGGPRLRVAITLRRFDAHFASKVQGRKILRFWQNPQPYAKLLRAKRR